MGGINKTFNVKWLDGHYKIKGYLFACWRVYDILRTFVSGPKHPLANKLFDMFGVNHGAERLWPIPWHVAWGRPNKVHRRHPHTMGDDDSVHFDAPTTTLTPQTSSTMCWQRPWVIVRDKSHGLARYITSNTIGLTKMSKMLHLLL